MPSVPILKPLEDDELLYSYILRLSDANGFNRVNEFVATYIWLNTNINYKKKKQIRKDGFFYIYSLFKAFNLDFNTIDFFKKTTLYPGIAPFITQQQQLYIINMTLRDDAAFLTNSSVDIIQKLKSCPECRNQQIKEKGYFWFKRSHQMLGINKCYIHNCELQICRSPFGKEYTDPTFLNMEDNLDVIDDIQYSKFVEELLLYDINADFKRIKVAIYKKLEELNYHPNKNGICEFVESIQCTDRYAMVDKQLWETLKRGKYLAVSGKILFRIFLCYFLFGSVDEMIKYIPPNIEQDLAFLNNVKDFEIYKPYHCNLIMMKHKECNTVFYTTPYGFISGFECPFCNKKISENELVTRLMLKTLGNTYKFEKMQYNSTGKVKAIEFIHLDCGKRYSLYPTDIFYMGKRCRCELRIPIKTINKNIQECGSYEVVEFINVNEDMKIKHYGCGRIFNTNYYKFLNEPYCRACLRDNDVLRYKYSRISSNLTEEKFIEILKDMTGDEYILDGHFVNGSTYVSIKHTICGESKSYKPNKFTQGIRCNCNKPKLSYNAFTKLVSELSYGKYKIIRRDNTAYYIIKNTATNEEFRMLKSVILQELRRLDGSNILPLEKKNEINELDVYETNELEFTESIIKQNYKEGIIFSSIDLQLIIPDYAKRSRILSRLVERGMLTRIGKGKFMIPLIEDIEESGKLYSEALKQDFPNKIDIISRYILINGMYIGYLYGKSLAYELGILKEKPDKLYVASNIMLAKKLDRTTRQKGKLILRKPFKEVNNDNYIILSIIDYLYSYPNYKSKFSGERIKGEYGILKAYLLENNIKEQDFEIYLSGLPQKVELQNEINRIYSDKEFIESVSNVKLDEKLYVYLKKNYKEYEIIYSNSVQFKTNCKDISWLYKKLTDKGLLKRVARGKYVFSSYYKTDVAIVEAMYKFNRTGYIGYTYGKSFKYEIGLSTEKPDRLYLCTNQFTDNIAKRRNKIIGDISVVIRKPIIEVSNQNYVVLPMIDFIISYSDPHSRCKKNKDKEIECLRNYVKKHAISQSTCMEYINYAEDKEYFKREIENIYGR